jgi:broad-specificity NMP kinase
LSVATTKRGKLIALLGPVGVGKSTVIRGLTQALEARGFKTFTLFIKAFHGPAYVLWILTAKLLSLDSSHAPWFTIHKSGHVGLARALTMLSIYLDALFSIPLKLIIVRTLRRAGCYVVSEEYMHSTLFDHMYASISLKLKGKFIDVPMSIINALLNKYPPDITVVLTANVSELKRRWTTRGYGDPQPRYVLSQYTFLSKLHHVFTIDTTNMSIAGILSKVLSEVAKHVS